MRTFRFLVAFPFVVAGEALAEFTEIADAAAAWITGLDD